jgi:5,10-methenyltetrahydromethanopterin hydrogenase
MSEYEDYTDEELDAMYEAARKHTAAYQVSELGDAARGCAVAIADRLLAPPLDWIAYRLLPAYKGLAMWAYDAVKSMLGRGRS